MFDLCLYATLMEPQIYAPRCEMSITINIATLMLTFLARRDSPCDLAPNSFYFSDPRLRLD